MLYLGRQLMFSVLVIIVASACAMPKSPKFSADTPPHATGSLTKRAVSLMQTAAIPNNHQVIYRDYFYSTLQTWFDEEIERDNLLAFKHAYNSRLLSVKIHPRGFGATKFQTTLSRNPNFGQDGPHSGILIVYWIWAERGGKSDWYIFFAWEEEEKEEEDGTKVIKKDFNPFK